MCPPSLSCTGGMLVPSSFAPSLTAMAPALPTMCCDRMNMGSPWLAPSAVGRLRSRDSSLTMVHSYGRPAKELVAAKCPLRSPRQRGSGSWRRRSKICSNSSPNLLQQQDKAKLITLRSTTLRWIPRRVRSVLYARRSETSKPTSLGPTPWTLGDRTFWLAVS